MKFELSTETRLFAESVRAAVGDWVPPREPELGAWLDDRNTALADRLASIGWSELWGSPALLEPTVAGSVELGRAATPVCLIDDTTLGGALTLAGRARHGAGAPSLVIPGAGGVLTFAEAISTSVREPSLDGSGTLAVDWRVVRELGPSEAAARWHAWSVASLGYLAGLSDRALELTVAHTRARVQFGAPLSALPAVQSRVADAALAVDALMLTAYEAASSGDPTLSRTSLLWAGPTCCAVTATAHQLHGAIGFALETGLHRYHRRAKAVHAWTDAVWRELR